MITKSLAAVTAVAASLLAIAPAQPAQAGVDIKVKVGFPGYDPTYRHGYSSVKFSCHKARNVVIWSGFHKVHAVDCSLPAYKYIGWKFGHKYMVRVSARGNIASVRRIF